MQFTALNGEWQVLIVLTVGGCGVTMVTGQDRVKLPGSTGGMWSAVISVRGRGTELADRGSTNLYNAKYWYISLSKERKGCFI